VRPRRSRKGYPSTLGVIKQTDVRGLKGRGGNVENLNYKKKILVSVVKKEKKSQNGL